MSGRVVVLNGPAGAGKSTVGRALAALVPNGVCIHGDCLKGFVVSRVEGAVEGGLGYKHGGLLAASFVAAGYDLVVFEYVFERPAAVRRFLAAFHPPIHVSVHLFTLWAPLDVILERERTRPGRERLGGRVVECYRTIEGHLDALGHRVENAGASPRHVAAQIYGLCEMGAGLCIFDT